MASSKRPGDLIANPFIKKRNLQWTLTPPNAPSLDEPPSPPPTTAAIESGKARIADPLNHFTRHLTNHALPSPRPLLPISAYNTLYTSSLSSRGSHFVIHQHDHPIAGLHYDLRLQINPSSSASWAVMYGLPGDPNSVRLNRNATETRIHSLWNHLIETASSQTGSLLIWDTGTYTILPRRSKHAPSKDPSSQTSSQDDEERTSKPQQQLLQDAFRNRKIRIQLHGTKLPETYVLNMRLTKLEDEEGRAKSGRAVKRRRRRRRLAKQAVPETSSDSDVSTDLEDSVVPTGREIDSRENVSAMDTELQELEDAEVRRTNAYPGASNTIGSIHQRKWYLSLDRKACGFKQQRRDGGKTAWQMPCSPSPVSGPRRVANGPPVERLQFPFYVRGVEHERSVVTSRTAEDILRDEGVEGFGRRKGWVPVLK